MTCLHAAVIYKTRATSLIHKLIALNYHRRILFTEIFSYTHGINYKAAVALHKDGVCEAAVRAHLKEWKDAGITFVRD